MRIGESPFRRLLTRDSLGEATALAFTPPHRGKAGCRRETMKRIVEIRPAEGGEDAQMFAGDLAVAFEKLCLRQR